MSIEFDNIKLEDEAAVAALDVLKSNPEFKKYVSTSVKNREEAVRTSVMSEAEQAKQAALAELDPIKKKVDEFRTNNLDLKKQLEAFNGFDPDEYKRLKSLGSDVKAAAEQMKAQETEYQERMKRQHEEFQEQLQTRDTSIQELTGNLTEVQRKSQEDAFRFSAYSAIQKHNAERPTVALKPRAVDKLVDEMTKNRKIVDGKLVMLDNGREFTTDAGVGSLEEWIDKVARRDLDFMFEEPTGGGAPGGTGDTTSGRKTITRNEFNAITDPVKRSEVARTKTIVD